MLLTIMACITAPGQFLSDLLRGNYPVVCDKTAVVTNSKNSESVNVTVVDICLECIEDEILLSGAAAEAIASDPNEVTFSGQ